MAHELAEDDFPTVREIFAPALYTTAELKIIRDNLGKSGTVTLSGLPPARYDRVTGKDQEMPEVNRETVKRFLDRLRELEEMNEAHGIQWCGLDAVREHIDQEIAYKEELERRKQINPTTARQPTMWHRTRRGQWLYQGTGTDRLRARHLDLKLVEREDNDMEDWTGKQPAEATEDDEPGYQIIEGDNFWRCPVEGCNHQEEFNAESAGSRNLAKGRMRKHFTGATKQVEEHRVANMECFA